MMPELHDFADEQITYREWLIERALESGVPWPVAVEAVSSTLLDRPYIDADEVRTRREWEWAKR